MVTKYLSSNHEESTWDKVELFNLLGLKLEYMKNTCNSHPKENSSITTTKLHYIS